MAMTSPRVEVLFDYTCLHGSFRPPWISRSPINGDCRFDVITNSRGEKHNYYFCNDAPCVDDAAMYYPCVYRHDCSEVQLFPAHPICSWCGVSHYHSFRSWFTSVDDSDHPLTSGFNSRNCRVFIGNMKKWIINVDNHGWSRSLAISAKCCCFDYPRAIISYNGTEADGWVDLCDGVTIVVDSSAAVSTGDKDDVFTGYGVFVCHVEAKRFVWHCGGSKITVPKLITHANGAYNSSSVELIGTAYSLHIAMELDCPHVVIVTDRPAWFGTLRNMSSGKRGSSITPCTEFHTYLHEILCLVIDFVERKYTDDTIPTVKFKCTNFHRVPNEKGGIFVQGSKSKCWYPLDIDLISRFMMCGDIPCHPCAAVDITDIPVRQMRDNMNLLQKLSFNFSEEEVVGPSGTRRTLVTSVECMKADVIHTC